MAYTVLSRKRKTGRQLWVPANGNKLCRKDIYVILKCWCRYSSSFTYFKFNYGNSVLQDQWNLYFIPILTSEKILLIKSWNLFQPYLCVLVLLFLPESYSLHIPTSISQMRNWGLEALRVYSVRARTVTQVSKLLCSLHFVMVFSIYSFYSVLGTLSKTKNMVSACTQTSYLWGRLDLHMLNNWGENDVNGTEIFPFLIFLPIKEIQKV